MFKKLSMVAFWLGSLSVVDAFASEVVYRDSRVVGSGCGLVYVTGGTTGTPHTGWVKWKDHKLVCNGTNVATIESWTTQYTGSGCEIFRMHSSAYENIGGRKCSDAIIIEK